MANSLSDDAQRNLDRQIEWISRMDGRAAFVLSADVLLLSGLTHFLRELVSHGVLLAIALIAAGLLASSLVFVAFCNFPRLASPNASLFYFGTIASQAETEFRNAFSHSTTDARLDDLLTQCHRNAQIVALKSKHLARAYKLLFVAVAPWLLAIALGTMSSMGGT